MKRGTKKVKVYLPALADDSKMPTPEQVAAFPNTKEYDTKVRKELFKMLKKDGF